MVNGLDIAKANKAKLIQTLNKFPTLFGCGLGLLNIKPVDIELQPGSKPYAGWYYNIPKAYNKMAKTKNARLVTVDVLEKLHHVNNSPWIAPSFCQIKKTGDQQCLTNFKEVNKCIQRKSFLLPKINESLKKFGKFKSATAIDLSKGYYSIPLSKTSQKICTTTLPWGKYAYKRLPMGIVCAPDIFQSIMMDLHGDLDYVLVYIDNILLLQCHCEKEKDHLKKMDLYQNDSTILAYEQIFVNLFSCNKR